MDPLGIKIWNIQPYIPSVKTEPNTKFRKDNQKGVAVQGNMSEDISQKTQTIENIDSASLDSRYATGALA